MCARLGGQTDADCPLRPLLHGSKRIVHALRNESKVAAVAHLDTGCSGATYCAPMI